MNNVIFVDSKTGKVLENQDSFLTDMNGKVYSTNILGGVMDEPNVRIKKDSMYAGYKDLCEKIKQLELNNTKLHYMVGGWEEWRKKGEAYHLQNLQLRLMDLTPFSLIFADGAWLYNFNAGYSRSIFTPNPTPTHNFRVFVDVLVKRLKVNPNNLCEYFCEYQTTKYPLNDFAIFLNQTYDNL